MTFTNVTAEMQKADHLRQAVGEEKLELLPLPLSSVSGIQCGNPEEPNVSSTQVL
jgi:hypothetical protein